MLPCSWIDQAHKTGTIKVLQDTIALAALRCTQVQQQISVLASPQFWNYLVNDARWHYFLKGENTSLNLNKLNEQSTLSEKNNVNGEKTND